MEDKLLEIFADVNVLNHYGLTVRNPSNKWVMAKDIDDEFKQINIEGGAVFHRANGKTRIEQKGCQLLGITPIVSVIVTKGCIMSELNKISSSIRITSISYDTSKNIKYELNNDPALIGYECLMVEHVIRDVIFLDNRKPVEATCPNAILNLIQDGEPFETLTLASGSTTNYNIPSGVDATVTNSDISYTATVASGGTLVLPDTEYIFTVAGVQQAPLFLPTLKNETINIVWQ
jgi:hypothetical protein